VGYYAIVTPAFTGHVNPMTVLAQALQKRGHRVVFIGPADVKTKAEKAGFEFIQICTEEFPLGEWEVWTAKLGELAGIKANRFAGHWIGVMSRGIIRELPGIIAREKFDGVLMDQIAIGAEAVCEVTKTPVAAACCALAANPEWGIPPSLFPWNYDPSIFGRLRNCLGYLIGNFSGITCWRAVAPYRRKHRLGMMRMSHMNHVRPSLVLVTQQPRFFDFRREYLPAHFHYTGPWREITAADSGDFPWHKLDRRPLIYASLGTLQNRLQHVFQIIAEACSTLDAQLVLALGNKNATPPPNLAGNPIVVGYAPQAALIKRANFVITHCGLNTTLETLSEGIPLVGIPITNDQPGVATRVEYLGAGIKIPVKELTTERLRSAMNRIQTDPNFRIRARDLANQIAEVDGPALAAELIEKAFVSQRPVTSTIRR
jgi:MGT family glycosyltransferase